jgi:CheY-like chemotaxis protein
MRSVLVIDDEAAIVNLLSLSLQRAGYAVETASNGIEGLRKIDRRRFDIIISDIKMPHMNGNEFVEKARKSSHGAMALMVGISGTPWLLTNTAFDKVFAKPFSLKSLIKSLQP